MGNLPLRIDAITEKAASQLVVNAAVGHAAQAVQGRLTGLRVILPLQQKCQFAGVGKLGGGTQAIHAAVQVIKMLQQMVAQGGQRGGRERGLCRCR